MSNNNNKDAYFNDYFVGNIVVGVYGNTPLVGVIYKITSGSVCIKAMWRRKDDTTIVTPIWLRPKRNNPWASFTVIGPEAGELILQKYGISLEDLLEKTGLSQDKLVY